VPQQMVNALVFIDLLSLARSEKFRRAANPPILGEWLAARKRLRPPTWATAGLDVMTGSATPSQESSAKGEALHFCPR
jgi:hypothetical protein